MSEKLRIPQSATEYVAMINEFIAFQSGSRENPSEIKFVLYPSITTKQKYEGTILTDYPVGFNDSPFVLHIGEGAEKALLNLIGRLTVGKGEFLHFSDLRENVIILKKVSSMNIDGTTKESFIILATSRVNGGDAITGHRKGYGMPK